MKTHVSFLPEEKKAVFSLASIYGLRMLGLFLIMPVIAIDFNADASYENALYVGLVIGAYGLTQALFQIPFGIASDFFGRKPVILLGLFFFATGSFMAAFSTTNEQLIFSRLLQGVGAISAAVTALLSDLTRDIVRTRAMAFIGIAIAISFIFSLIFSPILYGIFGLKGLFFIIGILALIAFFLVLKIKKPIKKSKTNLISKKNYIDIIFDSQLLILNFGVFFLMFTQAAMFLLIPNVIKFHGFVVNEHWKVYLPVLIFSFIGMIWPIRASERTGRQKIYFVFSIFLLIISVLFVSIAQFSFFNLSFGLFIYFLGFNLLEAFLPSWVSKVAKMDSKGLALGLYNTFQALGIFAGGLSGGFLYGNYGVDGIITGCLISLTLWIFISLKLKELPPILNK